MEQKFIVLSAVKNKIFEKNIYMQKIYPEKTRSALEVFKIVAVQAVEKRG
ncbi:MAG: hypothetical protein NC412_12690 [Roseburia sp.]|nr:hypothetical protein [Roseburia sp.]